MYELFLIASNSRIILLSPLQFHFIQLNSVRYASSWIEWLIYSTKREIWLQLEFRQEWGLEDEEDFRFINKNYYKYEWVEIINENYINYQKNFIEKWMVLGEGWNGGAKNNIKFIIHFINSLSQQNGFL